MPQAERRSASTRVDRAQRTSTHRSQSLADRPPWQAASAAGQGGRSVGAVLPFGLDGAARPSRTALLALGQDALSVPTEPPADFPRPPLSVPDGGREGAREPAESISLLGETQHRNLPKGGAPDSRPPAPDPFCAALSAATADPELEPSAAFFFRLEAGQVAGDPGHSSGQNGTPFTDGHLAQTDLRLSPSSDAVAPREGEDATSSSTLSWEREDATNHRRGN